MINAVYASLWAVALWKWGDWKNWKEYYPTILFFIVGDFLYLYLLSDRYPMWTYSPATLDEGLTHSHIVLSIMLIKYPATILIYLSHFPKGKMKKVLYVLLWVFIYAVNELADIKFNLIKYDNGWGYGWSILFNTVMFTILGIHYKHPILAWILAGGFIVFLWNVFDVPSSVFR